ncbi:MAG: type I restriction enzyme HsdR N-terminal domain-containing protein [Defluviitaleaceae bacterium]|nr:type I restriction enzyme HsdR N-terminal domain-containing protein [Defluviitaleaceae bacterium]
MTFFDQIKQTAKLIKENQDFVQNEAQTISYLVYPFLKDVLGYDSASPREVAREYGADIAGKKGEKVDIALLGEDGSPNILIEVKNCKDKLGDDPLTQLQRYFPHTPARVCILTNGLVYKFYSEKSDGNNKTNLDSEPFLEVDLLKYAQSNILEDETIKKLQKFQKKDFDVEEILNAAEDLKYTNAMKEYFKRQLDAPDEEFVRVVIKGLTFETRKRNIGELYAPHVKQALVEIIGERVGKRIAAAGDLERSQVAEVAKVDEEHIADASDEITPSQEELDCYYIVKAILARAIDPSRVTLEKTKTVFSIRLDGKRNSNICRLNIGARAKSMQIIEADNKFQRYDFEDINGLYAFEKELIERINVLSS